MCSIPHGRVQRKGFPNGAPEVVTAVSVSGLNRSGGLAPATAVVITKIVVATFRAAVADRLIMTSPADGVRAPKIHRSPVVPLTVEQVHALADAVPDRWRAAVILAAGTGLRQGEVLGLTVDRVDSLRREVHVDRQLATVAGVEPMLGPVKTAASVRVVPLPQVVLDALAEHLAQFPAVRDGLVFTDEHGRPVGRPGPASTAWGTITRP